MPMLNRFSKESSSTIIVCQPQTLQTWCPGELTFNCLFTPPPTLYKIDLFVDERQREEIILNLLLVFRSLVCLLLPLVEVSHGGWQDNLRPRYHHHNHDNHRNHHHESFIPLQSTQWFHDIYQSPSSSPSSSSSSQWSPPGCSCSRATMPTTNCFRQNPGWTSHYDDDYDDFLVMMVTVIICDDFDAKSWWL